MTAFGSIDLPEHFWIPFNDVLPVWSISGENQFLSKGGSLLLNVSAS